LSSLAHKQANKHNPSYIVQVGLQIGDEMILFQLEPYLQRLRPTALGLDAIPSWFLRASASIAIARISYGNSVCSSVRPTRPDTNLRPGEIEILRYHRIMAYGLQYFVTKFHPAGYRGSLRTKGRNRGTP